MVEQNAADAASLMIVENGEGDLRVGRIGDADVARDADKAFTAAVAQSGDESDVRDEIELGEAHQLVVGHGAFDAEKPMVDRLLAEALEMLEQAFAIVGAQGADVDRSAVTQDFLGAVV